MDDAHSSDPASTSSPLSHRSTTFRARTGACATSMNGRTPAKSIYEAHRQWAYKSFVGTVIEVADSEC
jgi:hypothetical protein